MYVVFKLETRQWMEVHCSCSGVGRHLEETRSVRTRWMMCDAGVKCVYNVCTFIYHFIQITLELRITQCIIYELEGGFRNKFIILQL